MLKKVFIWLFLGFLITFAASYMAIDNLDIILMDPMEVDFGNGQKEEITDLNVDIKQHYSRGEYILKFKNVRDIVIDQGEGKFEIEVLQWGKIVEKNEKNIFRICNVSKIYEPEPDRIPIIYDNPKFTEIPEWLFSKKVTSTKMSKFGPNDNITSIPEGLFKNNVNATTFWGTFEGCRSLTSIPEGLFKNNVNATTFWITFEGCTGLTSIPEGLFKNNVNINGLNRTFEDCTGLTSIPEGLFKNNVNINDLYGTFTNCTGLTNIPETIVEFAKKVKERGGNTSYMFWRCTSASNYSSIPDYMK